tara:strand:- start:9932 stop:10894 length:963 start_codon:yes stop_codon:yes gene_type:complete
MNHNILRLKQNKILRNMCVDINFLQDQLIQPIFISQKVKEPVAITGLDDNYVMNLDDAKKQIEKDIKVNCKNFLLFLVPEKKSLSNFNLDFHYSTIKSLKETFSNNIFLWSDVCLCSLTQHGHCCLYKENESIDLDRTLIELSKISLTYAEAGIDGIAPSDMMDGRTRSIRNILDKNNFNFLPIMSYSTKFSSNFYGPFRDAADSAPKFGNRKQYQLDYRNKNDAIRSSIRCANEGADLLMVKPALYSLDLIENIKNKTNLMVGAYQVSGEYAGLTLSAKEGLMNFNEGLKESWYVIKRSGAQFIISYGSRKAKELNIFG